MSLVCAGDTENEGSGRDVIKFLILSDVTLGHFVFRNSETQLAALGHLFVPFRISFLLPARVKIESIKAVRFVDLFK
jgi:hypothetical protein